MKNEKRILAAILAVSLLALAGCGLNGAEAPVSSENNTLTAQPLAVPLATVSYTDVPEARGTPPTWPMSRSTASWTRPRMGNGALPASEAKDAGYEVGDVSYWPPAGSLVILYKQNGEVFEQQPIGHIDGDVSFFDGMGTTDVTFALAE